MLQWIQDGAGLCTMGGQPSTFTESQHTTEVAALGRPFQLGMLYDCRNDSLIPGVTLWDNKQLQRNTSVEPRVTTEFKVTTSDSIEEKANALKVSGSLKLSMLAGLVDVSGSAKYFEDTKKSCRQSRVTLQYHRTTKYEHLTMGRPGRGAKSRPNVFGDNAATHVVTAVLYGADAYFVFDREVSPEEDQLEVERNAELIFNKQAEGGAALEMSDDEKKAVEQFRCTFHGDFRLTTNPTSFDEAVRVYSDLPKLLGEDAEHAVPLRVWLYPIDKLISQAAGVQREISNNIVTYSSEIIENLLMTEMKCNDLLKEAAARTFPKLEQKIEVLKKNCHQYKIELMQKLGRIIPSVRRGAEEEDALAQILKMHEKSPFNSKALSRWIQNKERESEAVKSILVELQEMGVEAVGNPGSLLFNLDTVVCFTFTSIDQPDVFLSKLSRYLTPSALEETSEEFSNVEDEIAEWITDDVMHEMRKELNIFTDLKKHSEGRSTKFIVSSKQDESQSGSCIFVYQKESNVAARFVPPVKLKTPSSVRASEDSLSVKTDTSCMTTEDCRVEYRMEEMMEWSSVPVRKGQPVVTLPNLKPNTEYEIRILAVGMLGYTVEGEIVKMKTLEKSNQHIAKSVKGDPQKATLLQQGRLSIYSLNLKTEGSQVFFKKDFCKPTSHKENKTIMLLGATGSGKTTLINGMVNYMLGVQWNDDFRFKLINEVTSKTQAESQTSEVTAYQLHHQEGFQVPYSVTIIDTPGFGDTRGIRKDREIIEKIREFFSNPNGLLTIDAVCFVVQSALARLTQTQKYVFDSILSIFGKDIANNIIVMITFADGQAPPVLEALKTADIPCAKTQDGSIQHFKFNNSALFVSSEASDDFNFDRMFWKMGNASMKTFFDHLNKMESKSLQLTNEVLKERKILEITICSMQKLINTGLLKLHEIKATSIALQQHKCLMEANKDFEYEVDEPRTKKIDNEPETYVTNCLKCNFTCHYPCLISNDADKEDCAVMENGSCTICPGKCNWDLHHNVPYRFEVEIVKKKDTYHDLKKRYEAALGKKMNAEKIMQQLGREYKEVQENVFITSDKVNSCLNRLQAIALRPDPLSTPEYIEMLIESEKQECKPGYQARIAELREVKKHAELVQRMATGGPPDTKKRKVEQAQQKKCGLFSDMSKWFGLK
ncbi:uncharacterized protein LOC114800082 isoform X1 [Denticeps clupeoides]|uniref:uncharacterized protein LOC114800082 isoform X1 n=1 Tax=Denticeps clupeoides TaxID=299321 RepID=UPI0010A2F17A|nr:uncharacterized protein LOC114800082 isoform X1 [Denticeps clupeoides]